MKYKRKKKMRSMVSWILCASMLTPTIAPVVAEAAMYLDNIPRYIDFERPEVLELDELGINIATDSEADAATRSNAEEAISESTTIELTAAESATIETETVTTATDSNIREPEEFYEFSADEPEGVLVQFDEERGIRTYQQSENEFVTLIGGYSGLYRDVDGRIRSVDNQIIKTGDDLKKDEDSKVDDDDEDWDDIEIELINDLEIEIPAETSESGMGLIENGKDTEKILPRKALSRKEKTADIATASNSSLARVSAARTKNAGKAEATPSNAAADDAAKEIIEAYYNEAGPLDICLPEKMNQHEGYTISDRRNAFEVIPLEGDYSRSIASGNMVRYSSVFPNVDVQYTVLGSTVKEDIILLDYQERNTFSYRLKSDTLKFKKDGDILFAYKDSWRRPQFALTAPVMVDAEGNTSTKIRLYYDSSEKIMTYVADQDWLSAEDRAYPVRLDPAGAVLVEYSAFTMNMVAKGGDHVHTENAADQYFGTSLHPMAGYSEDYGYCRALIQVNADWESLMGSSDTGVGGNEIGDESGLGSETGEEDEDGVKNVELVLHTVTKDATNNTGFSLYVASNSWDPATVTWNKMKGTHVDEGMNQTGDIAYSSTNDEQNREMTFNVTDTYYKWIQEPSSRTGFVLQANVEGGDTAYIPGVSDVSMVSWAETFYNQMGGNDFGPCLRVAWQGRLENVSLETLDMSEFAVDADAGVVESQAGGRTVRGILVHGISQAGSTIDYRVKTEDGKIIYESSTDGLDEANCPDFEEVDEECLPADHLDSNWQSDPVMIPEPLELNQIYYAEAMGTGKNIEEDEEGNKTQGSEEVKTEWIETDRFLLYEVQATDILPRIARHYGVDVKVLQEDNHFGYQLVEAGNILFIRNPKTDEPYTMPLGASALEEFLMYCLLHDLDPRCMVGGEPVNLSTGGFYMSRTDASFEDLDGEFAITRSYSGLHPYFRSEFGMGWNSLIGERIMVLPDGSILYTTGSGKGIVFEKDGDHYKAPDGYDYELKSVDGVELPEGTGAYGDEDESDNDFSDEETENRIKSRAAAAYEAEDESGSDDENTSGEDGGDESDSGEKSAEKVAPSDGWEITEPDGTVRTFNYYGLLLTKSNRKEQKTSYVYDSDYLLTEIIAPSGKSYGVTMEPDGKITEIMLPDGGTLTYEYDDEDNLTASVNPQGDTIRYEYDENHRMIAWYDENGNCVIENVLDDQGRVIQQTDALGNVMTFEYSDGETAVTDNNGNVTVYGLDSQMRNISVRYANGDTEKSSYLTDNRLESRTDAGGSTTSYTYDEDGNILKETREDGSYASFTYNEYAQPLTARDYEGNVIRFAYDEKGNLVSMTDGAGNTTRYVYDGLSRVVSITDANGNVSRFSYDGDNAPVTAYTDGEGNTSTYTYDEMNRVLTETDPEGNTTEHTYNANGWETSVTAADGGVTVYVFSPTGEVLSITDPMGVETTFTYDAQHNILSGEDALGNTLTYEYDANYNRISETNAKGDVTAYEYDVRNRLVKTTDALGNSIIYGLDGMGNILSTTDRRGNTAAASYHPVLNLPVMTVDELGNETGCIYDNNGNITRITYPDGTSNSYAYDGAGRIVSTTAQNGLVTEIGYDGNGNIIKITDDETRIYRFYYDGCNRLIKAVDPLGGVSSYAYDGAGNQILATDQNNHSTGYAYDAVGRLKEVTDALGGTVASEYDLNGYTLSATDQNGHTITWHYDVIGQVLAQVDAAENITAMEYDSLGNVTKVIDALKGETSMEVDALSRTVKVTDALGGEYTYDYDKNGNLIRVAMPDGDQVTMAYNAANWMTHSRDEAGVVTFYEYDVMGRIVKAHDTAGNIMTYEYDACGNLVKQTDTIGRDVVYEYDRFNHLVSVTGTDLATTAYTYDALDRLTSVTQADGTVTAYEYDPAGNLIKTTEPGEAVYTYTYDAINRLTNKVNPLGASTTFQYDPKGNLTGTTDAEGAETAYIYDEIDRLTTFEDGRGNNTVYEYDELSRLISYTTPEGNKSEYRYDALSRMTKAKDPNGLITEYQYDVMGNLVAAISPKGAKTRYTYDKHDELTSETDPAGNITSYTVDLNRRVTELTQKNGAKYAYTYDAVHRLTSITTPLGLKRELTYDVADNVVKDTDNLDRTNTYEYDIMHRMTKSVNAEGGVTTYGYDIRGNQNQLNNVLGYTWNYRYDLVDQLTESVDPEGKATEIAYNLVGEVSAVTKPGNRKTDFQYDKNYNVTAISDPKGYIYEYTYDKDNRLTGTKNPLGETEAIAYDPGSRVTSITDRMGLTESYTYDPHGNVLSVKATNGLVTRFAYDILDNLVKVTMPSSLITRYTYDAMGNVTSATDTMQRTTRYTYDVENNLTSLTDAEGRTERWTYDIGGRLTGYTSNGGNQIHYDYDRLNDLMEKSYEDARDPENKEGVIYAYDVMGQRVSMMDRSGESIYEYDGLGRIIKVTTGSGEVTSYAYNGCDQLEGITYADGKKVSYKYDKNDNLMEVTDRTGAVTIYVYDAINRVTEIHRPNGVSTYNTYNARDQIVDMKNICDDCGWVISEYQYTYDDRGFIAGETATESLYGYAWDDKHDGKHENGRHDNLYPHGGQHTNKHDKDGEYNFQIIETKRTFEYDDDGKLLKAVEDEERQGQYVYTFEYDDMGNRTFYSRSRNGKVQESMECTYNLCNQLIQAKVYDGKKNTTLDYVYDEDGNRISETGKIGTDKVELTYIYTVENRLRAVYDADELLAAMSYDGDGNRIFHLNYNLHTDDDWKGNSGNGNGNNKDNSGSGNSGNNGNGSSGSNGNGNSGNDNSGNNRNGNSGNNGNGGNGNHYGWKNGNNGNGNSGNNGNGNSGANGNTSTGGTNDNNGNANGNINNTGGSQNQSGILFPIEGEVSELEQEMIDMIKTTGKHKNYELIEYVNDVNREHTEVLMELNVNGIMDTAYSYGNERLTNERFTGWTGYYTYDPRGSVSGVTDSEGMIWQSYRYDGFGNITYGKPQYNNVYSYNAESYNPNVDVQYLRARYYCPTTADFLTEDSYFGNITDPLTLNRYSYVKSSPLNYVDPSGHRSVDLFGNLDFDKISSQPRMYIPMALYGHTKSSENDSNNLKDQLGDAVEESYITACSGGKLITDDMWQYDVLKLIESIRTDGYYSVGFVAGGSLIIGSVTGSVGIIIDGSGNIAFVAGGGWNAGSPELGVSGGIYKQEFLTVPNYQYAAGESTQSGGSISGELLGLPVGISEEINVIEDKGRGKTYYGTTTSVTGGPTIAPVEIHSGVTGSIVSDSINYLDKLEALVWSTVKKQYK